MIVFKLTLLQKKLWRNQKRFTFVAVIKRWFIEIVRIHVQTLCINISAHTAAL